MMTKKERKTAEMILLKAKKIFGNTDARRIFFL